MKNRRNNRNLQAQRRAAIERARDHKRAQAYLRAFDAAEGGTLFQSEGSIMVKPLRFKGGDPSNALPNPAPDSAPDLYTETAPDARLDNADAAAAKPERKHKATYASDKRTGGYLVRVSGPYPEKFIGREVPVTTRMGAEHVEKLVKLVWTGKDQESGEPVALYKFEAKPREDVQLPF
jgi:hypothetical protein